MQFGIPGRRRREDPAALHSDRPLALAKSGVVSGQGGLQLERMDQVAPVRLPALARIGLP